jgi:DNA polymerase elongation subunit (family B)
LFAKFYASTGTMPITFHILDAFARDEEIVSENDNEKVVNPISYDDDDDDEFKSSKKTVFKGKIDYSKKTFSVHLFGKTVDGKRIRCDVKGFKPFFYIRAPDVKHEMARTAIRQYLARHLGDVSRIVEVTRCERKELFGYTQDRKVSMLKLTMPSKGLFNAVKNLFVDANWEPQIKGAIGQPFEGAPTIYEANLDPMLRFLHLRNLKPCNWATVDGIDYDKDLEDNNGNFECDWEDIVDCEKPPAATAPFSIISWDIECMSNTGGFPVATRDDPVIQIGSILGKLGGKETEKHIFVLGSCDKIPEGKVYTFKDERALILGWFRWLAGVNPDILIGYNIFGFDEKYVWERCKKLGLEHHDDVQSLNMLSTEGEEMKLDEKRLSSSAMGDNFLYLWNTTGRLRVDLYHYIKRGYPLPSYKLDDTARNFLGEAVKRVEQKVDAWCLTVGPSKQDLAVGRSVVLLNAGGDTLCEKVDVLAFGDGFLTLAVPEDVQVDEVDKWAIVKDDVTPKEMFKMHLGTSTDRAIIARYCVQDCQLVLDLFKKLDVFNNAMSMANVCSVPVSYIFLRGQGIKIESLMFKYCYEREQCIVCLPSARGEFETYEGAIVLDPVPGFYTAPVGVADFASLYPSTIISENISHDTLVWVKDYNEAGNLIRVISGADTYDNLPGVAYTDIEYDNMIDDPEDTRKAKRKIKDGVRVCRYAQDRVGTIPHIVAGLLAKRKAKRKEGEKETDPFRKALLDSEQLAYKLTANSLYGQLGSGTFKIRLKPLAASVTAYGRKQIMFSKLAIETFYGPSNPRCSAVTVYGDTDSLFVAFNPKDASGKPLEGKAALTETIRLTVEAGKFVSKMLKAPHDFEFDKVYWPFIIFSKKRYVGHKYEDEANPDHYKLAFMGVALKRRDYAAIVKRIYSSALNILLHERDVPKAAALVSQMAVDLVEGKYGLQPLIISKSLRADYASAPAHKKLAERMAERDPGNAPASGDRIPYIYVQPIPGQIAPDLQGDRIETPTYIKEKGLKPDYMYYIDHQIANPVCQLFGAVVEQIPGFDEHPLPKNGWHEDIDKLTIQKESIAYNLLFGRAMQANSRGAVGAFANLLGATVSAKPVRATRKSTTSVTKAVTAQSTLDSMFSARMQVDAINETVKKAKKKVEEEKPKSTRKPKSDT